MTRTHSRPSPGFRQLKGEDARLSKTFVTRRLDNIAEARPDARRGGASMDHGRVPSFGSWRASSGAHLAAPTCYSHSVTSDLHLPANWSSYVTTKCSATNPGPA